MEVHLECRTLQNEACNIESDREVAGPESGGSQPCRHNSEEDT